MSQRASSARTRAAKARSGVMSPAVLPGVSRASRISSAMASASSRSSAASMRVTPSSASGTPPGVMRSWKVRHASVVSAGRKASLSSLRRA